MWVDYYARMRWLKRILDGWPFSQEKVEDPILVINENFDEFLGKLKREFDFDFDSVLPKDDSTKSKIEKKVSFADKVYDSIYGEEPKPPMKASNKQKSTQFPDLKCDYTPYRQVYYSHSNGAIHTTNSVVNILQAPMMSAKAN